MAQACCISPGLLILALAGTSSANELPMCHGQFQVPEEHSICFPQKTIGMCKDTHPSNDLLIETCREICGENMALTVGTTSAGVDKTFMNMVCLGADVLETDVTVLTRDDTLLQRCNELGLSFDRIQKYTGDFVGKFELVKLVQAKFAELSRDGAREMQEKIARGIDDDVAKARRIDKTTVLQRVIEEAREKFMPTKDDEKEVLDAVQAVSDAGLVLIDSLRTQTEQIKTFREQCLVMFSIPIADQQAQMVDLCATDAAFCMAEAAKDKKDYEEKAQSSTKHVGCCCAGIPAVLGSAAAPGRGLSATCQPDGRRLRASAGFADHSMRSDTEVPEERDEAGVNDRRLTDSDQTKETADVCLHAKKLVLLEAENIKKDMEERGLATTAIDAITDSMGVKVCDGRRLQPETDGTATNPNDNVESATLKRKLQTDLDGTVNHDQAECPSRPESPTASHWDTTDQEMLSLSATHQQREGYCSVLGMPPMQTMCKNFCGDSSIAFLLGTTSFGFSQSEADAVCMAPGGMPMSPTTARECLEASDKMKKRSAIAAELVVALEKVKVAKVVIKGTAQNHTEELNRWITGQAEDMFKTMNIGEDEAKLLQNFARRTHAITGGKLTQFDLEEAIDWVLKKANELEEHLKSMKQEVADFMDKCSVLTTGYDSQQHYMLDLCRVNGDKCLSDEDAVRAVCCCAYNPLVSYGTEPNLTSTIPGLEGLNRGRGSLERKSVESVCDTAHPEVTKAWLVAEHELAKLEKEQLVDEFKKKLMESYGLCPLEGVEGGLYGNSSTADGKAHEDLSDATMRPASICALAAAAVLWMALG